MTIIRDRQAYVKIANNLKITNNLKIDLRGIF